MSIESTLSALRTLDYSAGKLADLITDGIADAEVRVQVRETCLRELRWVDDLVGGEAATGVTLTDAEREALEWAEEIAGNCEEFDRVDTLRGLRERHAKGGEA